jgi:hypothetical protein
MSIESQLRQLGAQCVAGDLLVGRVVVGHYRDGEFFATPEGVEMATNVVNVETRVVEVADVPPPAPVEAISTRGRGKKAAPAEAPAADPIADLDSLLTTGGPTS